MKRFLISLSAIILLGTATVGAFEATTPKETKTVHMKIEGMTCGICEAKVKKQLSSLCKEITIDREKGEGICKHEASVTPDQILSEANKTGFKTSKIN